MFALAVAHELSAPTLDVAIEGIKLMIAMQVPQDILLGLEQASPTYAVFNQTRPTWVIRRSEWLAPDQLFRLAAACRQYAAWFSHSSTRDQPVPDLRTVTRPPRRRLNGTATVKAFPLPGS